MTKVKNRLLNFDNMIIYQDNDCFLFSLDSVLLSNFVTIKLTDKKIIDLCTGNAPIPMLLSYRTKARLFGVEVQKKIFDLGFQSVKENGLDKQIELINYDAKDIDKLFDEESFDVVTCNPPYFKYKDNSLINDNMEKAIARHEVKIKLKDVVLKAKYLLKNGGTLAMIHRPERLMEIIYELKDNGFELKKMQFVYPKLGSEANMVLIEAVKNGRTGLKILNPLIVHDDKGNYTEFVRKMFGGE